MKNFSLPTVRKDTPSCENIIHFNNAGTALSPTPVMKAVVDHLELEQSIGGYEAELLKARELEAVYHSLARLLNAEATEMAILQNATRAWDMIFYGLTLQPGDKILTCQAEYASNYIAFLQRAKNTGAVIEVIDNDKSGALSLDSLKRRLDSKVKVVAINHIPTNGGLVQPAEEVGEILAHHPAFYLLDACQSVGQLPLDVKTLRCDALTGTSRKYLRGPRGIGFLYLKQEWLDRFEPPFLDLHAATWTEPDGYKLRPDAKRFETYEIFVAGKLGLGVAVEYALSVGLERGWKRLAELARQARHGLEAIPGVGVHDQGERKGGIVTFTMERFPPQQIRELLHRRGINIWTSTVRSARLNMEARGLEELARASFHYYNSEEEVDKFLHSVRDLGRTV